VISMILCRRPVIRFLSVLAISAVFMVQPVFSQETEDSQIFIAGFNAYQQKDYTTAVTRMNDVLQKHPQSPLRDMTLFWLARAHFKNGNRQDAARYMSQFTREYPDNPLKSTVEEELLGLAAAYDKQSGEEQKRQAALKAEEQRKNAELAEQQRQAALKAEAERVKAEQARQAAAKAEQERIAAAKAAEAKRLAELEEQKRIAAAKLEEQRQAALKAEAERKKAELAEQQRQAAMKAEAERVKAEQARLAAAKAEQERIAAAKAAEAKRLAALEEQKRIAAAKLEEQRQAAIKAEAERKKAELAEQQRKAAMKAEAERVKAEQARLAAAKAEQERIAAAKAAEAKRLAAREEQQRIAAAKLEEQRQAALKAEEQRKIAELAEQQRQAAMKAEAERVKAEQARLAAAKAEQERIAAAKAAEAKRLAEMEEQKRIAAAKAEEQRQAAIKAEEQRKRAELAEQQRKAAMKAEAERVKAEQARLAAAKAEQEHIAAAKAAEAKRLAAREEQKRKAAEQLRMREKAISQYKSVVEKYPGTRAASVASAKLAEMGIAVEASSAKASQAAGQSDNSHVLKVEVAQFSSFDFNVISTPRTYDVASRIALPFKVTNRGNGTDSFYLESGFPADYNVAFVSATAPDQSINQTPALAPGETFQGQITLAIPASAIDGLRINYPVKAASRFTGETTQSREVRMIAAAPLLRSVLKSDKSELLPGDKIVYRIALLNLGSSAARNVTLRLDFPPQLEPLDYAASGFRQEMRAALVLDGLEIKSGQSREFAIGFQLKDDALSGQELLARAELINNTLKTSAAFVSNVATVRPVHNIRVSHGAERLVVIPGETVTVPFTVTNTGNVRDTFKIGAMTSGAMDAVIFNDLNRDGIRQSNEPVISSIGPLEPKEEARVAMVVKTSRSAGDGADGDVGIRFVSVGSPSRTAAASASLKYSRPVLQMAVSGRDGRLKPGEITTFEMNVANRGSNLARVVELKSSWPDQLELVASEPARTASAGSSHVWKFTELGAGEQRTIKVSYRVRPGIAVGANLQIKNAMSYEDQLGNRY